MTQNPYEVQYHYKVPSFEFNEEPGTSFCVVVPTVEDLVQLLDPTTSKEITIKVGQANTHPDDNFVYKIGRELAKSRLKDIKFTLNRVTYQKGNTDDDTITFFLLRCEEDIRVILFSIKKNRKHPHLESVYT